MNAVEGLWDYSVRIYGAAGVSTACLALQNGCGLDVNMILYCCWTGHAGTELGTSGLARALALSIPWAEHVVRPLRDARTSMKGDLALRKHSPVDAYDALREAIKALELDAEHMQQRALESITQSRSSDAPMIDRRLRCIVANLQGYIDATGVRVDAQAEHALRTLLAAASSVDAATARDALRAILGTSAG